MELENVRTTTEEDFHGVGVRVVLREECRCARKRICTTSNGADHRPREVGQHRDCFESDLVQDTGLIPITCRAELGRASWQGVYTLLTDEDVTIGGHDVQEWIQVVWVGPVQKVEEHGGISTRRFGKDLETGLGRSVGTIFAADDQDRTIGQHKSARIPAPTLEGNNANV